MGRSKQSEIWQFFDNNPDDGFATCKTCKNKLKNNRLSNLKTHLIKIHSINVSLNNTELSETSSITSLSKVIVKKKVTIKINKKQLLRSYIGLVTEDSIPFNVLNSVNMKHILNPICEGLFAADGKQRCLNASNSKKTLQIVANNIRNDITAEVKKRLLSLKIDSSTRLYRNIFGISAQFITNVLIKSRVLGMVELKGARSSTSKNLAMEIIKTLKKYDITLRQIVSVTSDNGANMLKATKILSFVWQEELEENEADCANDEYLKKIELVEEMLDMLLGDIQVCRCAAHTSQLWALDVTKSSAVTKYLLTCRMVELKGARSSTSKNLAMEIIKTLKKYDITLRQIVSVTSDNGANMLKATKILSFVWQEELEENEADCANDEYLKKIELVEEMLDMLLGDIQVCRCAAHTSQLWALDVTKSSAVTKYLLTCRQTVYVKQNRRNKTNPRHLKKTIQENREDTILTTEGKIVHKANLRNNDEDNADINPSNILSSGNNRLTRSQVRVNRD
ncbi:uncharacterized protein LOC125777702 [Bactrocera dorsalis]|uniref:Uncharacterized protein LOC125777702 n=1 Tax=Bactrocera dorsalis TaxID=27457 RepID=A0ABM3JI63_BACDO|nr:uncharacterized protein LOC125777702 [Bactrocera dorsalis]